MLCSVSSWVVVHPINVDPDPDPALQLNVDLDPDQGSKTSAVPCGSVFGSWSYFEIKKMNFYMKNVLEVENSSKNIPTKVQQLF